MSDIIIQYSENNYVFAQDASIERKILRGTLTLYKSFFGVPRFILVREFPNFHEEENFQHNVAK